jgi:ATPase subunit of ABC transporter with duplicated ATPase domains
MQRELEWVRMGAKARQAKGKARLANYEKMLQEDSKKQDESLEIYIPPGPRLGAKVIEAKNVSKVFVDRVLYENLNFSLPQGGIVGIIGPNGAGKTTLFRMIMGIEKPTSGTFEVGETVKIAYVDQSHSGIDPEKTVWQVVTNEDEWIEVGKLKINSRGYVSRFNFNGADQQKKIKILSGGERNRLHLALTLRDEANVLLLDEPTNDLDVNTIRALEEALENYAGCAVIISHDRWFLDRVCTHILAFEGDGQIYYFEGGFSDYEENKKQRLGISGDEPKKFRYKKLVAG